MNWFDTSGLTSLAKTALKEAQKTIDKALDIQDESGEEQEDQSVPQTAGKSTPTSTKSGQNESSDFLSSWGLTVSAESAKEEPIKQQPVVTESPTKASSQSMWGSFAGSFFEQPGNESDRAIIRPPKAMSLNQISDTNFGSQEDLFAKSQLVISDAGESSDKKKEKSKADDCTTRIEERRSSSRMTGLSLLSSRNSSDSVEVLSHSLKTTPDSEAASVHSISHSSSVGQKLNSESVEILPDSLVSPSSIECLGFDSYSSDKNSSTSSNQTPEVESSDKKSVSASLGDKTEKLGETADSISLVADDDEDTISYNSISECTAPTVLDFEEKSLSPFPKALRSEPHRIIHLDQLLPQKMQVSGNSSNDGSWSDRTLNADNDSITLEASIEEKKLEDKEDSLIEKLSDTSSFYNVNVSSEMVRSESSAFVNVEKQQCEEKDSCKERNSPISSDSKSDLVKIGSDRTSGHTSGDDIETATSSDIEIIPSPNGDNGHFSRNSPSKYAFKQGKFDGTTSPNLVDLVLGKSLATKIRGHNRELSEASIQSNLSDDSQGSENDRLMRRLSEMAEILEARESRLMEVSRNNAELAESNADLKSQVESLLAKHEVGDITTITEDYTQRMSALEKKFQQAIREKDQLRKQLDSLKSESATRKNSSEFENVLKEKDDMIAQLQEEGEKLSRQQLQHSNIIKKLRAKEKDNEQVIKSLRDKIAEQSSELDRLKRSVSAKEELEVTQIEAVYRLTTANKKLENELHELRSTLDDTAHRLDSTKTSLDVVRRDLQDSQRNSHDQETCTSQIKTLNEEKQAVMMENERLKMQLQQLRVEMVNEQKRWSSRTESLRLELESARADPLATTSASAPPPEVAPLLSQLSALQQALLNSEQARIRANAALAETEASLARSVEREKLLRSECSEVSQRVHIAECQLDDARRDLRAVGAHLEGERGRAAGLEGMIDSKSRELKAVKEELLAEIEELKKKIRETEDLLAKERAALEAEKKRNTLLQDQLSTRLEVSPPQSVSSEVLSASLWAHDDLPPPSSVYVPPLTPATASPSLLAALESSRRRGDALSAHNARLQHTIDQMQNLQEQYDALLQMYGEKEEQLEEVKLDLQDVTQLYKAQLDELVALKQQVAR